MNRICRVCKKEKSIFEYYRNSTTGKDGYHTMCKDCTYEYKKSHGFQSGRGNYENTLRWKKKNRDKVWCYQMLNDWVRDGRIIKPKRCYECGEIKDLEAHHDDYTKPLRVYWLCTKCHGVASRI